MTPNLSNPPQWASMFWDLVILLAFVATWAYLMTVNRSLVELRSDTDNLLTFNRISRYHALNENKGKGLEDEHDEG